jgi:hypothetical protein
MTPLDAFAEQFAALVLQHVKTGDDLVELPGPFEASAAERLRKSGELPARKVGRRWYARKSDMLALIPAKGQPVELEPAADNDAEEYARLVARKRARAR